MRPEAEHRRVVARFERRHRRDIGRERWRRAGKEDERRDEALGVEVGDLATSTLEEVWNGDKFVDMRKRLLDNGLFPVCRRCCKVELAPEPLPRPAVAAPRRAIPLTVVR